MTRRCFLLLFGLLLWPVSRGAAETPPARWIVVTAPAYRAVVEPLCAQRKAQGMQVVVLQTTDLLSPQDILAAEADKLRQRVNDLCRETKGTSYVLLVGAVAPGKGMTDAEKKVVPPLRGTAGRMRGQPSDNRYGCPGEGLQPTVAVGRLPARTEEEARGMVRKTLAYERDTRPGEWRSRITILAGAPEFSLAVDALVEKLALARFDQLHPSWSGQAIYHNAQSRFCVPDMLIHDRALAYVQEGQAITLYIGHSNAEGFWAGRTRYLDRNDWGNLTIRHGPGVFATFGCNGCQLGGPDGEGYGVAAIRNPGGPVAVLGSHGICFAAMCQLATEGLFEGFTGKLPDRLGEIWLRAKAAIAKHEMDGITYWLLDQADGDPKIPQATQRLEHLEMFLLLGDPALKLPAMPLDVKLAVTETPTPGKTIAVRGEVPEDLAGAKVRVTLERPLTSVPTDLQSVPKEPAEERARVMAANHVKANRFVLATKEVSVRDGRFEARLDVPATAPWPRLLVRAYAVNERRDGLGVLPLKMPASEKPSP